MNIGNETDQHLFRDREREKRRKRRKEKEKHKPRANKKEGRPPRTT
jgi:hypothetical protein